MAHTVKIPCHDSSDRTVPMRTAFICKGVGQETFWKPAAERPVDGDKSTIDDEMAVLDGERARLHTDFDTEKRRVERGVDYLNYVLIHGTKVGTETNNYVRRLQRSIHGFEARRLLRLRVSVLQLLQNYQFLRELLNPISHRFPATLPISTVV